VPARLAVEAAASLGWHKYTGDGGDCLCLDRFGASAPGATALKELGFNAQNVIERARALLG
jgi:transketolase